MKINKHQSNPMLKRIFPFVSNLAIVLSLSFFVLFAHPAFAVQVDFSVAQQTGLGSATLESIVVDTIKIVLGLLGLVSLVITLYGGFTWMMSGGNVEKITKAKKTLGAGFIGLVIVLGSFSIAQFIFGIFNDATGGTTVVQDDVSDTGGGGCVGGTCLAGGGGSQFSVSSVDPKDKVTKVALCRLVQATFSSNVDPISVTTQNFKISYNQGGVQNVAGSFTSNANAVVFKHSDLFPASTNIYGFIAEGTGSIKNLAGVEVDKGRVWSFTTGTDVDTLLPTVEEVFPGNNSDNACRNTPIQVVFSEIMNAATLTYDTIKLFDNTNNQITLSRLRIGSDFKSVSLYPASALEGGKQYRVVLSSEITDACDNHLDGNKNGVVDGSPSDDFSWAFTTGEETVCEPIITSTSINAGYYDNQSYEVTITGKHFGIVGDSQFGNLVAGDNTFDGDFAVKQYSATKVITRVPVGSITSDVKIIIGDGKLSNSPDFSVLSPYVSRVDDNRGRVGNFFTIYGTNFGEQAGEVWFIRADGTRVKAATLCTTNPWTASYTVANVPEGLVDGNYKVQIISKDNFPSNLVDFVVDSAVPSNPGLCSVLPLCTNAENFSVTTTGVNLGTNPGILEFTQGEIELLSPQIVWQDTSIGFQVHDVKRANHRIRVSKTENGVITKSNPIFLDTPCPPPAPLSPVIKSISPDNGISDESGTSTIITILGDTLFYNNLTGLQTVYNGAPTQNFGTKGGVVYFCTGSEVDDTCVKVTKGECFSWSDNSIVLTTPPLNAGTYNVFVSRENRFLSELNPIAKFTRNNIIRPGLCQITPNHGPDNTNVTVTGKTLGDKKEDVSGQIDYVAGGSSHFANIVSWSNTSVAHQSFPDLPEQIALVHAGITIPANQGNLLPAGTYQSNPLAFYSDPVITELSPTSGPIGTYVSVFGKNFGIIPGRVVFVSKSGTEVDAAGTSCSGIKWSDTFILVSVPSGLTEGEFDVRVEPFLPGGVKSNSVVFNVNKEPLGPQLCSIPDVDQPFTPATSYNFTGDNFGTNPGTDQSTLVWSGINQTSAPTGVSWSNTSGTFSIPSKEGNGSVKMKRTIQVYLGRKCTVPTFGGVCFSGNFEDTFATRTIESNAVPFNIGDGPRIIDNRINCDSQNPQALSPAPLKNSTQICKQELIHIAFDKPIERGDLNYSNINVAECGNTSCSITTKTLSNNEFTIIATNDGFIVNIPSNGKSHDLKSNTTYRVSVGNFSGTGIRGKNGIKMQNKTVSGLTLGASGYVWSFTTSNENCVVPKNARYTIANNSPLQLTTNQNTATISTLITDPNTCSIYSFGNDTWTLAPSDLAGITTGVQTSISGKKEGTGTLTAKAIYNTQTFTNSIKIDVLYGSAIPKPVVRTSCNSANPQDYSPAPKNKENNVCKTSKIYLEFNQQMDSATLTTANLRITKNNNDFTGYTITPVGTPTGFYVNMPNDVLDGDTEYEIFVSNMKSAQGFEMEPYSWSFKTSDNDCVISTNSVVRINATDPINLKTFDPFTLTTSLYDPANLCQSIAGGVDAWTTENNAIAQVAATTGIMNAVANGSTKVSVTKTINTITLADNNGVVVGIEPNCKDQLAINYNPNATISDPSSCKYVEVNSITPNRGLASPDDNSTVVSISGKNFGTTPGSILLCPTGFDTFADCVDYTQTTCRTWTDSQVVTDLPLLSINKTYTVFVKTSTEKTNIIGNNPVQFLSTDELQPGLCSVKPSSGIIGATVVVSGHNLGNAQNNSSVLFGTRISQVKAWKNTEIITTVPELDVDTPITARVQFETNLFKNSNPIPFFAPPVIEKITPDVSNNNGFISIIGKNFGQTTGKVYFKTDTGDIEAGYPSQCSNNWSNNLIIVQVPAGLNKNATVRVVPALVNIESNKVPFTYNSSMVLGPQLCALLAPVVTPDQLINFQGYNFSNQSGGTINWSGLNITTPYANDGWSDTQVTFKAPNKEGSGTLSLSKTYQIATGKEVCNGFEFGSVCLGVRSAEIKSVDLKSNEIPFIVANTPLIVERTSCTAAQPISPAPAKNATSVCRNADVYFEFSQDMDGNSLNSSSVRIVDSDGNVPHYTIIPQKRGALVHFAETLLIGKTYTITIDGALNNLGVGMLTPYSWSFTTGNSECTPTKGSLIINNTSPIILTESDPVTRLTASILDQQCSLIGANQIVWMVDNTNVAEIINTDYANAISYGTTSVHASFGNLKAQGTIKVSLPGDLISSQYPFINQDNVCRNTLVSLTLKNNVALPVDNNSITLSECGPNSVFDPTSSSNICLDKTAITGNIVANENGVFFIPFGEQNNTNIKQTSYLKANTVYEVSVGSLTMEDGSSSQPIKWLFRTVNTNGICTIENLRLTPLNYEFKSTTTSTFLAEALDGVGKPLQASFSWKIDDDSLLETVNTANNTITVRPVGGKNGETILTVNADAGLAGNKTASTNITVNSCQQPWSGLNNEGELYDPNNQFSFSYCLDGGNPNLKVTRPAIVNTIDPQKPNQASILAQYFMTIDTSTTPANQNNGSMCSDSIKTTDEQCDCGTDNICTPASLGNNTCAGTSTKNNIEITYCSTQCKLNVNSCFAWDNHDRSNNIQITNGILKLATPTQNGSVEYVINSNLSNHKWSGLFWNGSIPSFENGTQNSNISISYTASNACSIEAMAGGALRTINSLDANEKTINFDANTNGSCLYIKFTLNAVNTQAWAPQTVYNKGSKLLFNNQVYDVTKAGYTSATSIATDISSGALENITSKVSPTLNSMIISSGN